MDAGTITYEAYEDTLIIHMPKELDHHNCRKLKTDTDLMLEENCVSIQTGAKTHGTERDLQADGRI